MTQRFLLLNLLCLTMLVQSCKKDQQPIGTPPGGLHIDSFAPETAAKDSVVVITGANFSPDPSKNIVKFNDVTASITAATVTTLTVRVPISGTGQITVETGGKRVSSAKNFTYIYTVSTLAGDGIAGFREGEGTVAEFKLPFGIAVDASGDIYVGEGGNNRIRNVNGAG